ncbi:hypothetical protein J1N35_021075 [Gossypium stocksii]|uniref:RING-type domain-containing protein n=1 Tax=Gossypium stocksii TaxID=47602 RepID=A0A9D3VF55_9ROSI|nr:hypothetical protein J1N35_021075 [Gossypium stocksii]
MRTGMRTGDQKAQEQVIRVEVEDEVGFVKNSCALETLMLPVVSAPVNERNLIPVFSKGVVDINDYPGSRGLKWERDCVMCLSKEKIVVLLPCAHQTEPQMNAAEPCDNSSCMHHKCSDKICSFGLLQLPPAGQDMVTN